MLRPILTANWRVWLLPTLLVLALVDGGCRVGARPNEPALPAAKTGERASRAGAITFTDITAVSGVRFRHVNGATGQKYMPETMGSGCAFIDYDGDGRLDLFLVNSGALPGTSTANTALPALYHNEGSEHSPEF